MWSETCMTRHLHQSRHMCAAQNQYQPSRRPDNFIVWVETHSERAGVRLQYGGRCIWALRSGSHMFLYLLPSLTKLWGQAGYSPSPETQPPPTNSSILLSEERVASGDGWYGELLRIAWRISSASSENRHYSLTLKHILWYLFCKNSRIFIQLISQQTSTFVATFTLKTSTADTLCQAFPVCRLRVRDVMEDFKQNGI